MQYGGFGAPVFFCDLKLGKSHQITICLTYVNQTASIKWDNKANLLTKKLRIVVKYPYLTHHVEKKSSSWMIDRHCGIFLLCRPLPLLRDHHREGSQGDQRVVSYFADKCTGETLHACR